MTDFRRGRWAFCPPYPYPCPPHQWAAPKRSILNRVKFVQMSNLSKVARLQSTILLKKNYLTGSFKLSEWLHSYHCISTNNRKCFTTSTSWQPKTLIFCPLLYIYHICTIQWRFENSVFPISVPHQHKLRVHLKPKLYLEYSQISKMELPAKIIHGF